MIHSELKVMTDGVQSDDASGEEEKIIWQIDKMPAIEFVSRVSEPNQ